MREIKLRIRFENDKIKTCLIVALNIFERDNPIAKLIEAGNKIISIEEFTGLKDKNGKEIYEGDIVKIEIPLSASSKIVTGQVILNVLGAEWQFKNFKQRMGSCAIDFIPQRYNSFNLSRFPDIEVIGNTYENPELLKETK